VKIQGQYTSGPCSITQRAAITALKAEISVLKPMQDAFLNRRNLLIKLMKDVPNIKVNNPGGAFYLFPEVSYYFGKKYGDSVITNAKDLCMYLLNVGHVAMTPGGAFGAPNYIRLSYATSEEIITEAVGRIKNALSDLK